MKSEFKVSPAAAAGELCVRPLEVARMGVSMLYQAIPPESELFQSLKTDPAFHTLLVDSYPHIGLFTLLLLDPEELEEILESIILGCEQVLGTEPQARRVIDSFQKALEATRAAYPGIERRAVTLEKSQREINIRLPGLLPMEAKAAEQFVSRLLYGEQALAPQYSSAGLETLWFITPGLAVEGAKALEPITAQALFPGDSELQDHCREGYLRWKHLLGEASRRGEAILVGSA